MDHQHFKHEDEYIQYDHLRKRVKVRNDDVISSQCRVTEAIGLAARQNNVVYFVDRFKGCLRAAVLPFPVNPPPPYLGVNISSQ